MLTSRDTPFDEDGHALIIEDLKRLNLLIANGANDLNAGAVDATQQAINDLASGLNQHEVDPQAHAELFAAAAATAAAAAGTTTVMQVAEATPATSQVYPTAIAPSTTVIDTASGWNVGTGTYTIPTAGYYALSFSALLGVVTSAAGYGDFFYIFKNNGANVNGGGFANDYFVKTYAATGVLGASMMVQINTVVLCAAGDAITVTGGLNASLNLSSYSIAGMTISIFRI